jgi:hypothetical protein
MSFAFSPKLSPDLRRALQFVASGAPGSVAILPGERPWLLDVWERLATKAPSPALTVPYCWGIREISFYVRGWLVRPYSFSRGRDGGVHIERPARSYQEWDRVQHRLGCNERIEYRRQTFECGCGAVQWCGRGLGWWMRYQARSIR